MKKSHSKLFTNCHVSWDTLYLTTLLVRVCENKISEALNVLTSKF